MNTIKQFLTAAGAVSATVTAIVLAILAGNGGALPEWMTWYLAALAAASLAGLWARTSR